MFALLRDFVRSYAVLSKTTSLSDLRARHDKTVSDLRAAEDAHSQAEKAYVIAVAGAADGDVMLARKSKAVTEAVANRNQLRNKLQVLGALVDEAHTRETEAASRKAWADAARLAAQWQTGTERLQDALNEVAEAFEEDAKLEKQFRASLPTPPNTAEHAYLLWSPKLLARPAQQYLFARMDGAFETRVAMSPLQLSQGPDLKRRVADSIAQALRDRPQPTGAPEPPEAA